MRLILVLVYVLITNLSRAQDSTQQRVYFDEAVTDAKNFRNEKKYEEEKSALKLLKTKPAAFKISLDDIIIKGAYVKGKRDGIWKTYSIEEETEIAVAITYHKGNLILVEKCLGYSKKSEWHSRYYNYFFKCIIN